MAKQQVQIAKNFAFNDLTNCYSVQKTLKFSLIPQGKTLEHIHNKEFLKRDKERFENAQKVKEFVDEVHREFITNALEHTNVAGWEELEKVLEGKSSKKEKDNKKAELRKAIKKQFNEYNYGEITFKDLSGGNTGFITSKLPKWMKAQGYTDGDISIVNDFGKFATAYFKTFMTNRQNFYAVKGEATSVFTRAVDENFIRFISNKRKLNDVKKAGIEIEKLSNFNCDLIQAFSYNKWLSPQEITNYNECIGAINSQLNEAKQNKKLTKKVKLNTLYKQILCEGESSFKIEQIENDGELVEALKTINNLWFRSSTENPSIIDCACEAVNLISEEDAQIKIETKNLNDLSKILFDRAGCFYVDNEKVKSKTLLKLLEDYGLENEVTFSASDAQSQIISKLEIVKNNLEKQQPKIGSEIDKYVDSTNNDLIRQSSDIDKIRNYLDAFKEYERVIRLFQNKIDDTEGIEFYVQLNAALNQLHNFDKLYDKVRNYLTQKPYSTEKLRLMFDINELNAGGAKSKESAYRTLIFKDGNKHYLGIFGQGVKSLSEDLKSTCQSNFKIAEFDRIKVGTLAQNLLKIDGVTVRKTKNLEDLKNTFLPKDINEIRKKKSYLKSSGAFSKEDCSKYIKYYMERLVEYRGDVYHFNFKDPEQYEDFNAFIQEASEYAYAINFACADKQKVLERVECGDLLLFQIYNKDFSKYSSGAKNLHTLYWEELFSEANKNRGFNIELCAGASLYYRKKSIKPKGHKAGEILVNKTYEDDDGVWKAIPDDIYVKATKIAKNGSSLEQVKSELSKLDRSIEFNIKECKHEIVKDKRYTKDHFQFHVPITLNRCPEHDKDSANYINQHVLEIVRNNKDVTFLGIDRGERHLLYLTLIDKQGNILMQKSMNLVPTKVADNKVVNIDYHSKLDNKQKSRDKSRKSWTQIENIKDLKQGYLSQVVYEIAKIVVEHNAVIVMEDLNRGFKRGRQKFEKQVYQRFEKQLIDKLSYLSFKPGTGIAANDVCGIANGLQLCPEFVSFEKLNAQHGIIFYVRPWNTSHIDPTTGFMNLFRFPKSNTGKQWKEFFGNFNAISYDKNEECFRFDFKYSKFDGFISVKDYQDEWSAYTHGQRLSYDKNEVGKYITKPIDVTEEIETLFRNKVIGFKDKQNLKDDIFKLDAKDIRDLGRLFKRVCNLRNSETNSDVDYILSPVKNSKGEFFDSRNAKKNQPENADANGAYHIALKGLHVSEKVTTEKSGKFKVQMLKNIEWNEWIQKFHAKKC